MQLGSKNKYRWNNTDILSVIYPSICTFEQIVNSFLPSILLESYLSRPFQQLSTKVSYSHLQRLEGDDTGRRDVWETDAKSLIKVFLWNVTVFFLINVAKIIFWSADSTQPSVPRATLAFMSRNLLGSFCSVLCVESREQKRLLLVGSTLRYAADLQSAAWRLLWT